MAVWSDLVKLLVEKHLIPTLVSIVVAIILPLVVSPTGTLLASLSRTQFSVLWFCVCFLLIRFVIYCSDATKASIYKRCAEKQQCEEALNVIWSAVDKYSPSDLALLKEFLRTNNNPINVVGDPRHSSDSLLGSQNVHSRVLPSTEPIEDTCDQDYPIGARAGYSSNCTTEYTLTDAYYQILSYSQTKYGRISHFVDQEQQPANSSEH